MEMGLVCQECKSLSPMEATACVRCSGDIGLASAPPTQARAAAQGQSDCDQCGATIADGHKFCGGCGTPTRQITATAGGDANARVSPQNSDAETKSLRIKKTMSFVGVQPNKAKLVLIRGDGMDGVSFTLAGHEHLAGRQDTDLLFENDTYMSPCHANFYYQGDALVVRDEDSYNGVYVRIRNKTELKLGSVFLIGEQILQVEETSNADLSPKADGTYVYASPRAKSDYRLVQLLRGGGSGIAYRPQADVLSLGREDNDLNFPEDPFISGHHAQLSSQDGCITLSDLDSKNGTFVRIDQEVKLQDDDYVFLGQQLFRVEMA